MAKGNTIFKDIFLENKVKVHLVINSLELEANIRQSFSNLSNAKDELGIFGAFFLHSRYKNNSLSEIMFEAHLVKKGLPDFPNSIPRLDPYLIYTVSDGKLSLYEIAHQSSKWTKFNESKSLFPILKTEIPFETTLTPENGIYKYPFLDNGNNISYFEFPESYANDKNLIEFFDKVPKQLRKVN